MVFVVSMAIYPLLGTQLFPTTDAGKFIIHMRSPAGTRIEVTQQLAARVERVIREVIPPNGNRHGGRKPGPRAQHLGDLFVQLGRGHGRDHDHSPAHDHAGSTFHYMDILKRELPTRVPEVTAFFSSGSIIDSVLNFGLPAPIDIQVSGPDYELAVRRSRTKSARRSTACATYRRPSFRRKPTTQRSTSRSIASARPALGLTEKDVVTNVITALTSNQMIAPSIWIDRTTGNDYFLTTQYREQAIDSIDTLSDIPVHHIADAQGHEQSILLRNVATIVPRKVSLRGRPLQHPARGRRAGRSRHQRPGRNAERDRAAAQTDRVAARRHDHLPRRGRGDAEVVLQLRAGTWDGGGAAVPGDGRAVCVVPRPLHHHVRGADGAHRRHLDAVADQHDAQYRVVHGNHRDGWNRGVPCVWWRSLRS